MERRGRPPVVSFYCEQALVVGEVRLDGRVIAAPGSPLHPGPDRLVVFQHGGLFPWMTVIENVCYGPVVQQKMQRAEALVRQESRFENDGRSRSKRGRQ